MVWSSWEKVANSGVNGGEDPPVPIPNTEVKLTRVENTWLETAWEDRTVPAKKNGLKLVRFVYCLIAQLVEHAAVNRRVVGSSLTEASQKEEQWTRSMLLFPFVNFFRLALTVLRFGDGSRLGGGGAPGGGGGGLSAPRLRSSAAEVRLILPERGEKKKVLVGYPPLFFSFSSLSSFWGMVVGGKKKKTQDRKKNFFF